MEIIIIFLQSENIVNELQSKEKNTELVGSFRVEVGDMDQCVNIWRYKMGNKFEMSSLNCSSNRFSFYSRLSNRFQDPQAFENG